LPPEQSFMLSHENSAQNNLAGLELIYEGLHLLRAEPEPANKNHKAHHAATTPASRLLMSRRVFETIFAAEELSVKYLGSTYWGAPGWHEEVCELVWHNPLEYISEKRPYALERFLVMEKLKAQPAYDTYRTRDRTLERPVILKALRPEIYVRRLRDESQRAETVAALRRLGRLEHPGIALIYDMGTHEDIFYFVREHIEGENLAQSFARQQRLSPVEAARLLLEICRILRYAHQNGVCHGNLKPSNIWRVKSAVASEPVQARALLAPPPSQSEKITIALKISDFFVPGFSEISSAAWHYAPPELHGQNSAVRLNSLRATADVYALGMILYDCIGGENPFKTMQFPVEASIWEEVQLTPFSVLTNDVTGLLPALDEVIQRATYREPFHRHQTIEEFETALRQVLKGSSSHVEKRHRIAGAT
jgi:serine/threonine-protein kinase